MHGYFIVKLNIRWKNREQCLYVGCYYCSVSAHLSSRPDTATVLTKTETEKKMVSLGIINLSPKFSC